MNRIDSLPDSPTSFTTHSNSSYEPQDSLERNESRLATRTATPHAVFTPVHYESNYSYPLIVWLHGSGGNERQLQRIMPLVSMRNYVAVAPQGTANERDGDGCDWPQTAAGIEAASASVFDCLTIARRSFNIHNRRIFLLGYGSGGTMAVRLAWEHPETFAGVATIGGPLPRQNCPLRNVNRLRQLPCFLATSRASRCYPEAQVCRDLRLLHSAGFTVALRQYTCGDELTTAMLSDFNHWAMESVTASS
jgi:phospholipase/carboxylesterase